MALKCDYLPIMGLKSVLKCVGLLCVCHILYNQQFIIEEKVRISNLIDGELQIDRTIIKFFLHWNVESFDVLEKGKCLIIIDHKTFSYK